MTILLDSHALIWFLDGDPRFSARARDEIEKVGETVLVSAVTAWEIANKARLGKRPAVLEMAKRFEETVTQHGFDPLAITLEHARVAGFLPGPHRDPFDRMLAAQSQVEGVPLVTADPAFRAFGTSVLW
jgi:PIN domain nuclease of toxin-antitoxin system